MCLLPGPCPAGQPSSPLLPMQPQLSPAHLGLPHQAGAKLLLNIKMNISSPSGTLTRFS